VEERYPGQYQKGRYELAGTTSEVIRIAPERYPGQYQKGRYELAGTTSEVIRIAPALQVKRVKKEELQDGFCRL
jgi:hypothetical protein